MSDIDKFQHAAVTAIAAAAAHEGTVLGIGDSVDEITDAIIGLRDATKSDFVKRYGAASRALHANWTRRVGTPGYKKAVWMEIDNAMVTFARAISARIGFEGSWIPVECLERPARAGDHYRFTYPNEPKYDKTLLVARTGGDGPEDLVFFEDYSYSKQKNLNKPGAERVSR